MEDVERLQSCRGVRGRIIVQGSDSSPLKSSDKGKVASQPSKPQKASKYRAIACIVTEDLTLFTSEDIRQMTLLVRTLALPAKCSLKDAARAVGVIGEWFGSLKEAHRWIELKRLEMSGTVRELRRQVPFSLDVNGTTIGKWIADFVYAECIPNTKWEWVREDSKGVRTPIYKRSKAHVEAQYGFTIRET